MINYFRNIGENLLQGQEPEEILKHLTILPDRIKTDGTYFHAISINFDLDKKTFEFKLDKELISRNRDYFFAFRTQSSNGKKIYLATNNRNYLYENVFDEISVDARGRSNNLSEFVETVLKDFYKKGVEKKKDNNRIKNIFLLDPDKLEKQQKNKYRSILNNEKGESESDEKKKQKKLTSWNKLREGNQTEKLYDFLLKELFPDQVNFVKEKNDPGLYIIKFKGKTIKEFKEGKYYNEYIEILYHHFINRFYRNSKVQKGLCHICGVEKEVPRSDIPLPMKFLGTTNNLYFEHLNKSTAYKSYGLCEECLKLVMTGMHYVQDRLADYLFGITTFLIPHLNNDNDDLKKDYKKILELFKNRNGYANEIQELSEMIKKSTRKNIEFDLMFYHKNKNEFNINKLISNIELRSLISKLKKFEEYSNKYKLYENEALTLNLVRNMLFPSKYSENTNEEVKKDKSLKIPHYKNKLLKFIDSFIQGYKFNYRTMIRDFMNIAHRKFNHNNFYQTDSFKMILILEIFIELEQLKGLNNIKKEWNMKTKPPEKYLEYFNTHSEIYEDPHKQGLFLLGVLINRIIYAQRNKSSNFLKKINFGGISPRKVASLVNQVKEYSLIYNVFEEGEIWGATTERLQDIETSHLSNDEIVFYILTGQSYDMYLGIQHSKSKNTQNNKEE